MRGIFTGGDQRSRPAAELLRQAERGNIGLFVSREILEKIRDVFSKPKVLKKNPQVTAEFVDAFLTRISITVSNIESVPRHFSFSRDPKDEKYIDLAIETKADYLVSRDGDLLDLMTNHSDEAKEFRQRFRPLRVIDPLAFLHLVRITDVE